MSTTAEEQNFVSDLQELISHLAFNGDQEKFLKKVKQNRNLLHNGKSRHFDEIFLERILETMKMHTQHQPRRNILFSVLSHLIQTGIIDINISLVAIASSLDLICYPQLWIIFCDLISTNITRASLRTLEMIITQLLDKLQATPVQISPFVDITCTTSNGTSQSSLQMYTCAQKGVKLLSSFLHEPLILPIYKIINITQKFYKTQGKLIKPHWILAPFTDLVFRHKQNLANLLIPTGRLDRCRIASKYRDDLVTQGSLPYEHQMIDSNTTDIENGQQNNDLWQKGVYTLLSMLCDQVPVGTVLSTLISTQFNAFCPPNNAEDGKDQKSQPKPSQMLLEAAILRVKQLISYVEQKTKTLPEHLNSSDLKQLYDAWWGEWQRFGSQFYNFVEEEMIDFELFVCKVAQYQLHDNGLIWLLSQCLMIERLKGYFMKDITEHNGWLTSTILSFYNKQQSEQFIRMRDTSVDCLIYRIWAIFGNNSQKYLVNGIVPPSIQQRTSDLDKRRSWWHTERDSVDFFQPGEYQISVCLLSNFSSMPVIEHLHKVLSTPVSSESPAPLPGNIQFIGRSRPLSIYLLSCLSMKAQQRLLHALEKALFELKQPAEAPGVIETYVRLIGMAPTVNRYKLQCNFRSITAPEHQYLQHILLEIINFRLVSLFRFNQATKWLIIDIHESLMKTTHHQLFNAIENLFIKSSLYQTDINSFRATVSTIDFGITANRMFLISIARTINLHGISDYSTLTQKLPPLCQRLIQLTGAHTWESRSSYFPAKLKEILKKELERCPQRGSTASLLKAPITREEVQNLASNSRLGSVSFREHEYSFDSRLWLPVVLTLKPNQTTPQLLELAKKRLALLKPMELVRVTYEFVDFLLDEFIQKTPKSVAGESYREVIEELQPAQIQNFGSILDGMIWSNQLISFNRFLLALADRDDDPNAFVFINYFLLQSQFVGNYIQKFLSCQINPRTWEEPDFYSKISSYFRECPPTQCQFSGQPLYPIYYGSFPLRLLPILDCLVMRFFETGNVRLLYELFSGKQQFVALYSYHEAPVTFVKEIFNYYYCCDYLNPEIKNSFLQIVHRNPDVKLSEQVNELRSLLYSGIPPDFDYSHFEQTLQTYVVQPLDNVTDTSKPNLSPTEEMSIPFHTFQEFATHSDRILATSVIELLLFPYQLSSEIVNAIISPIKSPKCTSLEFSTLNAMGLLLASLPRCFEGPLFNACVGMLCSDDIMSVGLTILSPHGSVGNPLGLCAYTNQGANPDPLLNNRTNAVITLLHSFFHYSTIEVFESFSEIVRLVFFGNRAATEQKVLSYHHLYVLCRLLAPWVYRISSNTQLMDHIIIELFVALQLVDQSTTQQMFDVQCDISQSSSNPNSVLWLQDIIIDFLFHMNNFAPNTLSDPTAQENVASVVDQLSPQTKAKFRYFFHK